MVQVLKFTSPRARRIAVTATMVVLFACSVGLAYWVSHPSNVVTVDGLAFELPDGWSAQSDRTSNLITYTDAARPQRRLRIISLTTPQPVSARQILGEMSRRLIPPAVQQIGGAMPMPRGQLAGWLFLGSTARTGDQGVQVSLLMVLHLNQLRFWVFYLRDTASDQAQLKRRLQSDTNLLQMIHESAILIGNQPS